MVLDRDFGWLRDAREVELRVPLEQQAGEGIERVEPAVVERNPQIGGP